MCWLGLTGLNVAWCVNQSTFMGYLQGAGSLGRIIGPVVSGQLLSLQKDAAYGAYYLFLSTAGLLFVGVIVLWVCRRHVVPPQ